MQTLANPSFAYTSPGSLWQVLPVPRPNHHWLLEERSPEGQVSFVRVDARGEVVWRVSPWPDRWWVHLAGVAGNFALVREYADDQSPEHQHFHVLDLAQGEVLLGVDNFSFLGAQDTTVYGYLRSGEASQTAALNLPSGEITVGIVVPETWPENNPVDRPFLYRDEDAGFGTVSAFVKQYQDQTAVLGAEYLETNRGVGLSFYLAEGKQAFANWLWWLSPQGDLLHQECLGRGLSGIGQDTFWKYKDHLFYIKNKQELIGYAL